MACSVFPQGIDSENTCQNQFLLPCRVLLEGDHSCSGNQLLTTPHCRGQLPPHTHTRTPLWHPSSQQMQSQVGYALVLLWQLTDTGPVTSSGTREGPSPPSCSGGEVGGLARLDRTVCPLPAQGTGLGVTG